jgi:AraC family transcriptional regulator
MPVGIFHLHLASEIGRLPLVVSALGPTSISIPRLEMSQTQMKESPAVQLAPPRFENGKPLLITGLRVPYDTAPLQGSAAQWQRLATYFGKIPGQIGRFGYGLCFLRPDGVDYLAGVQVAANANSGLPSEFTTVPLPAQRYAIFHHQGHVSEIPKTCQRISEWLPTSNLVVPKSEGVPDFFELYTEEFDPISGTGGMEIWLPIRE